MTDLHPFLQRIDDLLHESRQKRPWLAEKTGISLNTLNSFFTKNRLPRVDQAKQIADALNVTCDFLLTGQKEETISNHLVRNIVDFLNRQSTSNILKIEGALKMFNYLRLQEDEAETIRFYEERRKGERRRKDIPISEDKRISERRGFVEIKKEDQTKD